MPGMTLLPVPVDVVQRWIGLARQQPVTRGRIFDLQLVATMLGCGITTIYTFDAADFQKFSDLTVRVPQASGARHETNKRAMTAKGQNW